MKTMEFKIWSSWVVYMGFLILSACGSDANNGNTHAQQGSEAYEEITLIEGLPKGFEGCSCALSRNREEFEAEKYIYLESYGKIDPEKNISIISLDGEQIQYPRKQAPEGMQVLVLYETKGGGKSDQKGYERTGKLVIKQDNGATLKSDFYGVCGC